MRRDSLWHKSKKETHNQSGLKNTCQNNYESLSYRCCVATTVEWHRKKVLSFHLLTFACFALVVIIQCSGFNFFLIEFNQTTLELKCKVSTKKSWQMSFSSSFFTKFNSKWNISPKSSMERCYDTQSFHLNELVNFLLIIWWHFYTEVLNTERGEAKKT